MVASTCQTIFNCIQSIVYNSIHYVHKTTLILLIIFTFSFTISQTKYYSGLDNASQIHGRVQYRKCALSNYEFTYSSNNAFSDLNCLSHDYPVGGSTATDDWFVSREFKSEKIFLQ